MPYLPLPNFNHDSGPRRIQSGPDNEGYVVLYSGVEATGPNEGIVVAGSPLSGTIAAGAWDYDSNWRYVPGVSPSQSGSALDPTPYNASGALDTYNGTRIATRTQVAGAQAANAIGPEANVVQPRGGALQPRASVTQPEKYMYFGGAAPDNQGYSPYNTPDANTPAEGRTGGPVTHRNYENTLITNVFGTQGTSDRSQWRYHQPVYCKTYTETLRSQSPGLMSTPLRYIYRGNSTQYNENYPLNNGFQQLPYDDQIGGCGIPVSCPSTSGDPAILYVGDVLTATPPCIYSSIEWFNTSSTTRVGTGASYTVQSSDIGYNIYFVVTYPDASQDSSSPSCYGTVELPPVSLNLDFFRVHNTSSDRSPLQSVIVYYDNDGTAYSLSTYVESATIKRPLITAISSNRQSLLWSNIYYVSDGYSANTGQKPFCICGDKNYIYLFITKLNTANTNETFLHLLTINKTNGAVISDHAVSINNPFATPIATHLLTDGFSQTAVTDGKENFWICFDVMFFDRNSAAIAYVTKSESGLSINWAYALSNQSYTGTLTSSVGSRSLRILNEELVVGPYSSVSSNNLAYSFGCVLTRIDLINGTINKRSPWFLIAGVRIGVYYDSIVDNDKNEYYWVDADLAGVNPRTLALIKRSSNGNIVWSKNYKGLNSGDVVNPMSMVFDNGDLVLCAEEIPGVTLPTHRIHLLRVSTETGDIIRNIRIDAPNNVPGPSWNQGFFNPKLTEWKVENEYIIQDEVGYRMGINLNSITTPSTVSAIYSLDSFTPSGTYTITEDTTTGVVDASGVSSTTQVSPIYTLSAYASYSGFMFPINNIVVTSVPNSGIYYIEISKLA